MLGTPVGFTETNINLSGNQGAKKKALKTHLFQKALPGFFIVFFLLRRIF